MQLRAKAANIPLVLVSETGCAKDVWTSISFGAVDIMSCPLSRPKLQTLWQHVLRSQRSAMPSSLQMPARHVASVTKAPVPSVKMPLPPLKAQSPVDSRKRKAKDMTQTSMVAVRPPLAIKPGHSAHAMGMAISGGYQAAPSAPLVSYCVSPMVGISPVVSGARQVSWGQPVMGIPSSPHQPTVGVLPGQLGGFAFPQFVPYGHSTRLVSPVQIPASAAAPPSGSGVPLILPAGHKSNSVSSPVLACKTKAQKTESPGSPDAKSESCSSSVSDCSAIEDLICEDDLVTIPEPECFREVSPSPESSMSAEAPASCKPTSLDDISEEEYAFVDFALSDAFPAVDEDEILPPLGLALKKSDSLLNILNVQMVY